MKTVMRKKRLLIINVVAACILLLILLGQNSSLGCWDTHEWECDDACLNYESWSLLIAGDGGWNCGCHSGSTYSSCGEEYLGDCWNDYECSQIDCEGTCTYVATYDKYRCLVEL